jgi:hypothetical protein
METIEMNCAYKGFEIWWNDLTLKFNIFKNDVLVKEGMVSLRACQAWIDLDNEKKFKPVKIMYNFQYQSDEMEKGKAIGIIDDEYVWISAGDKSCKAKPTDVWLDIPENQKAMKAIRKKYDRIALLRKEIEYMKRYAKRLNVEMLLDK